MPFWHRIFRTLLTSDNNSSKTSQWNIMKFYLHTLKHLVIQLVKLQIYTLNLTATFWHCKKKSHYFWTGVYMSFPMKAFMTLWWDHMQMLLPQNILTHWGQVTNICVGKLTIIGSDNGLSPGRRQAIIWTNAGILLIGPLGTNFSEILITIETFSFKKMHLKCRLRNGVHFVSASMC